MGYSFQKTNWLNRNEAAEYLGVSVNTLANWACTGLKKLPYYKIGKKVMYKLDDLENFIEAGRKEFNSHC